MFALLVAIIFLQLTLVAIIPEQQYQAEWRTSLEAAEAFELLAAMSSTATVPGTSFSVTIPVGTGPVSPLATASSGLLQYSALDPVSMSVSFRFVPHFRSGQVTRINQDVILLMDSSGSMRWNDPSDLRISGAKEYVGRLLYPDRVAIVDFDAVAQFTRAHSSTKPGCTVGPVHHLNAAGHDGIPNFAEAQSDLDCIDSSGYTNFGDAIRLANNEFLGFGDPGHAWVMILLTDGQNCRSGDCPSATLDNLARSEAARAKALGITIYTIGLGSDVNAALLTQIATITGGSYFPAPTAESIRWIYFEISRRYRGAFVCGLLSSEELTYGTLSLNLGSRQYPTQDMRLEGGAIVIEQGDGTVIRNGFPYTYVRLPDGAAAVSLTAITLIGESFATSGSGYQVVQARLMARDLIDQTIYKVDLATESETIGNISESVQYWTSQGAATQNASNAIRGPLFEAERLASWAHENASAGDQPAARALVDLSKSQLSLAISQTEEQENQGAMQAWFADMIRDDLLVSGCKLDQWLNWYDGITIRIQSPAAAAWARWFEESFEALGADVSIGFAFDQAVITLHAVDTILMDRRILRLDQGA